MPRFRPILFLLLIIILLLILGALTSGPEYFGSAADYQTSQKAGEATTTAVLATNTWVRARIYETQTATASLAR